ncbi:MAG: triosephosphate isomerase [Glaciecola sp.]|jgi:triosephosphate isomerase
MHERQPIIAGNWKMHKDHLEGIQLVQKLAYHLDEPDYQGQDVVVLPSFIALRSVQTLIHSDKLEISLGAQTCSDQDQGAFTGEVSAGQLARLECRFVLCGHSERRALFGETDAVVNAKLRAVLRHDMTPILCVGESLEQREAGDAERVVVEQLTASLAGLKASHLEGLVVAYEPVWAIGTGKTASAQDAQDMCAKVRTTLADLFNRDFAEATRVQYGGSVKAGNIRELMAQPDIDGALVGGASLNAEDFALIVSHRR